MFVLTRLAKLLLGILVWVGGLFGHKRKKRASLATAGRPYEFFRIGVQYYLHGRQALLMDHPAVAGSLFHQGFEMMLKASLLQPLYDKFSPGWAAGVAEPKRKAAVEEYSSAAEKLLERKIRHRLPKAWSQFKASHPGANLNVFDDVVRGLDDWWQIRYPGFPKGIGLQIRTSLVEGRQPQAARPGPADAYDLCLDTMDKLFAAIAPLNWSFHWIKASMDPFRKTLGIDAYWQDNQHRLQL